jgi:DNA/RNA endonuclease YhcR with UshA esterase domain
VVPIVLAFVTVAAAQENNRSQKSGCVAIERAKDFSGKEICVVGKVYRVGFTDGGTAILRFCEDRECPFTAVVFERDLEKVGNVQMFEGRVLEVTGKIREYKGATEIVVRRRDQFSGDALSPAANSDTRERQGRWHR